MPIMFNTILRGSGLNPMDVRLLRHADQRADPGLAPYHLWRNDKSEFENYQSTQTFKRRASLVDKEGNIKSSYWASFVGTPMGETLFAALYRVEYLGILAADKRLSHKREGIDKAGTVDEYRLIPDPRLDEFVGRLLIEWGDGYNARIQRADQQDKPVIELRDEFREMAFPGYLEFVKQLSELNDLPATWISALRSSKGVYLLTCPKTKEQYVGSATGTDNLWGRWQDYVMTGHGGNIQLMEREPADYWVSILEVAGSAASDDEIRDKEQLWKSKLKSKEMGLNSN